MNIVKLVIMKFLLLAFVSGCSEAGTKGFRSDEPGFMAELEEVLIDKKIPFVRDSNGFIRYSSDHEEGVLRGIKEVEQSLSTGIAVRYDDKVSRDFLKQVLTSRGMGFREEFKDGVELIRWYPKNDAEASEIREKVAVNYFNFQKNLKSSDNSKKQ